ncbi:hypothetical protein BGAL_0780g00030 [Botrytis galanthina]|uniref:Uncharacterized protein n=1 Tax=Botrytis galanthina TaxID=278940 RepID=A0A4S8QJI6_9HELO|nr:hypothetical protein BGAL_0780g00030 [Botrytis galanthina]
MSPINIIWHCKALIPLASSPQNSTVPPPSDNWHCSSHLEHIPSASEEFWYNFLIIMAWTLIGITVIGSFVAILSGTFIFIKAINQHQEWENNLKAESKQLLAKKNNIKAKSEQLLAEKERQGGGIKAECQSLLTKDSGPTWICETGRGGWGLDMNG